MKFLGNQKFGLFLNNTVCLGGCTDRLVILGKVRFGNFEILTPFCNITHSLIIIGIHSKHNNHKKILDPIK